MKKLNAGNFPAYLRVKSDSQVVRCIGFHPATLKYDVETTGGKTMTLEQPEVQNNVTEDELLKFLAVNPESN